MQKTIVIVKKLEHLITILGILKVLGLNLTIKEHTVKNSLYDF